MFTRTVDDRPTGEPAGQELSARDRAILRAVAQGRVELRRSCEPDLYIDGLCCADQYSAHRLSRHGLIQPQDRGRLGQRVPAELTDAGHAALPPANGEAPARGGTRGPREGLHRC